MANGESERPWVVLKFGGTSVASKARWDTIAKLAAERVVQGFRPLVVHSALAGMTNLLEALPEAALGKGGMARAADLCAEVRARHAALAAELGIDGEALLAPLFDDMERMVSGIAQLGEASPRVRARLLALGERMATLLGHRYLADAGLSVAAADARDLLTSTPQERAAPAAHALNAVCASDPDPALHEHLAGLGADIVITQGFIARDAEGETVVLGRGGSDTSASILAARLRAAAVEIWTDVPGMFSADPRVVAGARLLKSLRYAEAQEIASMGGAVLHPRAIPPAREAGIPIHVRSTARPDLPGTTIAREVGDDAPRLKAISSRARTVLVSMETLGMWHQVGFLADAFRIFSDQGLSVDLVSTSESNVTVTLDADANTMDGAAIERLRQGLSTICRVSIIEDAAVVSLLGHKIRALLHEIGPAFEVFAEYPIHLVSQAASDLNLSVVVEEDQAHRLIKRLHALLVRPSVDDPLFGPTAEELAREGAAPVSAEGGRGGLPPWWSEKREALIAIAEERTSAYVYDTAAVSAAASRLADLKSIDRVFYAMKANRNADVLRAVEAAGLGFECVSPGELSRVRELFPEIDPARLLYTPNFAPRGDYEAGFAAGAWVTLDNLYPLEAWPELFEGRELILRVDTGQGRGHHQHVKTAGSLSKFGVPMAALDEVAELAARAGARVVGVHAHAGSGILEPDHWRELAGVLLEAAGHFDDVRIVNLGGGLGIPERVGDAGLDLVALDAGLAQLKQAHPGIELWLEPGRYVVAEAGVLLSRVTQLKGKARARYVGVATGMNSLIRPALYGAYHEIVNLSRLGEPAAETVTIVGPNCESGDKLGTDRLLPECREGDVMLIAGAGAYGAVMSSRYNLREPAEEVAV